MPFVGGRGGFASTVALPRSSPGHDFTVDHIVPRSAGGPTRLSNLCWCCFWCTTFKQARDRAVDPRTSRLVPLFYPRMHVWEAHFRWGRDGARLIGRTPVGRATVQALRLNRRVLVIARRIWARHGLHPPE